MISGPFGCIACFDRAIGKAEVRNRSGTGATSATHAPSRATRSRRYLIPACRQLLAEVLRARAFDRADSEEEHLHLLIECCGIREDAVMAVLGSNPPRPPLLPLNPPR